jgi:phage gpG-like protein
MIDIEYVIEKTILDIIDDGQHLSATKPASKRIAEAIRKAILEALPKERGVRYEKYAYGCVTDGYNQALAEVRKLFEEGER